MRTRNLEIVKAGQGIGHYLLPKGSLQDQAYWNKNWGVLRYLPAFAAVLGERRHFFDKTRSRNDAWSLITIIGTCWQAIRTLAGKNGADQKWIEQFLPPNHRELFPEGSSLSYVPIETTVENIRWAYSLHSSLRHPDTNAEIIDLMLNDPWPESAARRLLDAAEAIRSILAIFDVHLGLGNGFAVDIAAKRALAEEAERHSRGSA
jgi:hypothetical protein